MIGTTVGAALVVFLTLILDINQALVLVIYFIAYQQLENVTIQPWLQSRQTNLSTLEILITVIIGAIIAGMIGVLLFVPIVGCLKILLNDYLKHNKDRWLSQYPRLFSGKEV